MWLNKKPFTLMMCWEISNNMYVMDTIGTKTLNTSDENFFIFTKNEKRKFWKKLLLNSNEWMEKGWTVLAYSTWGILAWRSGWYSTLLGSSEILALLCFEETGVRRTQRPRPWRVPAERWTAPATGPLKPHWLTSRLLEPGSHAPNSDWSGRLRDTPLPEKDW